MKTKRTFGTVQIVTVLLLLTGCTIGQNKKEDKGLNKVTIPEFEIDFPQTKFNVEKTETNNPTPTENLLITNWILQGETESGPFMYYVTHHKFPTDMPAEIDKNPNSLKDFFQAAMTSSATKLGGENFRFTEYTYNNYPGLELICDVFNNNGIIKSRMIKVDNDVFVICAGGRKVNIDTVDTFLNSFALKK
jgi:hypothetical protein